MSRTNDKTMKKSFSEEIYPTSTIGKKIIYNKMVSHYKKIYNAKPWIDTNLKKKQRHWPQHPPIPHLCCLPNYEMHDDKSTVKTQRVQSCSRMKKLMSSDACTFKPAILDTPVKSKLNSLNDVYHPPRRKHLSTIPPVSRVKRGYRDSECSIKFDKRYALPETKMKNQDTAYIQGGVWPESQCEPGNHLSDSHTTRFRPQNSLCVHFLQDITDEILNTGVYSNEALKKVFQKHLSSNRYNLDQELMKKEIEHLEITLEIPINDDLNNADFGLGNGSKSYSPCAYWTSTAVDDNYVLEALESLHIQPGMKKDLIISLNLNSLVQMNEPCHKPESTTTGLKQCLYTDKKAENNSSYEVMEDLINDLELIKTPSRDEELCKSLNDISEGHEETEYKEKCEMEKESSPEVTLHDEEDKKSLLSLECTSISEISENMTASNSLNSVTEPE